MRPTLLVSLLLLAACAADPQAGHERAYAASLRESAVRAPHWSVPLRPLPEGETVLVARFQDKRELATGAWSFVALPEQLREFCRPAANRVLAIQQALGLYPFPRPREEWRVFTFRVPREQLMRPCLSGFDRETGACHARPLDEPTPEETPHSVAEAAFLLRQSWNARRIGTDGFPFTGMGWAYNWDPAAPHAIGASEFVLRPGTTPREVQHATPDAFCEG